MSVLGDNLNICRCNAKLSLRQVGTRIGKSASVISMYEKGMTEPPISTLIDLCDIYNVTPNDVLGYSNMPASEWRGKINNADIFEFVADYLNLRIVQCVNNLIVVYDENDNMVYGDEISMKEVYYQAYLIRDKFIKEMQSTGKSAFINSLKASTYDKIIDLSDEEFEEKMKELKKDEERRMQMIADYLASKTVKILKKR